MNRPSPAGICLIMLVWDTKGMIAPVPITFLTCLFLMSVYVCAVYVCIMATHQQRFICVCCRASGAMANASPDLDNAEAQRQLNNNNRPIGSGFWETECTSSKLFECSRIKALAGQRSHTDQHTHAYSHTTNTPHTHASVGV